MPFRSLASTGRSLLPCLLLTCLTLAGCSSDDRPPRDPASPSSRRKAQPTLTGRETYFGGRISAEVRIGAMAGFSRSGDGGESGSDRAGDHVRHHGGSEMGGGRREGMSGGTAGPGMAGGEDRPSPVLRGALAGGYPPVVIHLRFTNQGATPAEFEITDFVSALGNFSVQPAHLALAPGQSSEVEPMGSRLANDATAGQLSLTLRLEGVKEARIINVAIEPAPAPVEKN